MDDLQKRELSILLKNPVQWNCPLRDYTSFGIGGPASALVQVENVGEMERLFGFFAENHLNWRVIGRGTNLLVRDHGFDGIAVVLAGRFRDHDFDVREEAVHVRAGAGCLLPRLAADCAARGFSGLEFAVGIPGTVGGAVCMNAGAWGGSMADILHSVEIIDMEGRKTLARSEMSFSYRRADTLAGTPRVVTGCVLRLLQKEREEVEAACRSNRERRNQLQPSGFGNAGSIFKNPQGHSAGRLIESSGLKGMMIGDAQVSNRHANFIVNRGRASAGDVLDLIAHIQEKVEKDSGIKLDPEVHIL